MFRKDKDPARKGLAAHTAILHRLVSLGFEVLEPLSNDLRYDLAYYWEETGELVRIQCKTGRYVPEIGCILFKNYNSTGGRARKRGYIGDAEYFGVHCEELNKTYLVPVDLIPSTREVYLRVTPSKNNQGSGLRNIGRTDYVWRYRQERASCSLSSGTAFDRIGI